MLHTLVGIPDGRIEAAVRKSATPWAGIEIACTGTYLLDLPGAFEDEEIHSTVTVPGDNGYYVDRTPPAPKWNSGPLPTIRARGERQRV
jgi:hypothetical protein